MPSISLHITSFSDATLVAVVWPHMLMDASGGRALLAGWSSVLPGREEDIPMVLGAQKDILQQAAEATDDEDDGKHEEFKLEPKRLERNGLSHVLSPILEGHDLGLFSATTSHFSPKECVHWNANPGSTRNCREHSYPEP
jgi:hypothetical protein